MATEDLQAAKNAQNDEFYTSYPDIQQEINAYLEFNPDVFRDKVILLPCDDPEWSNFTKYFAQHFEEFGIKKLISTSYAASSKAKSHNEDVEKYHQVSIWELQSPKYDENKTDSHGKIFILERGTTADKNNDKHIDIEDLDFEYLEGDGDFNSDEIIKLRDEADIIVTNPPFSLFRRFIAWLIEADKKFLCIGDQKAITYKEVFPLIMDNRIWLGTTNPKTFRTPIKTDKVSFEKDGEYYQTFGDKCWYTNIDHGRRHEPHKTKTMADQIKFSKNKDVKGHPYQKYDNYDALYCPCVDAIPRDYAGVMGVTVSFLSKYCPEQFNIVGSSVFDDTPFRIARDYRKMNYTFVKSDGKTPSKSGALRDKSTPKAYGKGRKDYAVSPDGKTIVHATFQNMFIQFTDEWIASHPEDFKDGGAKI